ncbi:hypothetical protein BT69DRAFT_572375 [Atractiella rhizophila]|nr:hypothetical protein BT69DRAFT_572375 [Atractiella rhizophila]
MTYNPSPPSKPSKQPSSSPPPSHLPHPHRPTLRVPLHSTSPFQPLIQIQTPPHKPQEVLQPQLPQHLRSKDLQNRLHERDAPQHPDPHALCMVRLDG